jgi:two-component system, cell cycle sensor histidine kinase and response regulator CckA
MTHRVRDAGDLADATSLNAVIRRLTSVVCREWRGIDDALHTLTHAASEALGVARVSVWRFDEGRAAIHCIHLLDASTGGHTSGSVIGREVCPRYFDALATERVVAADDAAADPRTCELTRSYLEPLGVTSMLDAPVWEGGSVVGVICHEQVGPPRAWTPAEVEFAGAVGDLASLVLATARREAAERELRASDERHRRLFDQSPVPQWEVDLSDVIDAMDAFAARGITDLEAHFTAHPEDLERLASLRKVDRVNAAAVALYGAASEEALLARLPELTMPSTLEAFLRATLSWVAGDATTRGAARHRTLDGRTLDVMLSAFMPVATSDARRAVVSVVDFTEQKAAERLLTDIAQQLGRHTGQAYFRGVVDFMSQRLGADLSLVGALTPDGKGVQTVAVSRDGAPAPDFVYALEGTPCARVVGHQPCQFPDRVSELFPDDVGLARIGARAYVGTPLFAADGRSLGIVVAAFRAPLTDGGRAGSILQIFAARAAAELERRQGDEHRARLEAQLVHAQRLESVGRLAGGIAHDFNNLLAPILAYSEMAAESAPEEGALREDLTQISLAAGRASDLTRQLLAFSRRQRLNMGRLDLNEVIQGFGRMLRTVLRDDVLLDLRLPPGLPCVNADQGQIEQVIMNLVLNAQDAMPAGGRLTVRTFLHVQEPGDELHPDLPPGAFVCMEVSDTGTGMDANTLAHLFEPFFTTKGPNEGTGLGLATAYGIMQQHGGGITVESAPGAGARFKVFVPTCADAEAEHVEAATTVGRRSGSERILVVEDEAVVRRLVVTVLKRHGYDVLEAADPLDALELARDPAETLDLLVTDVVMPEMDGVELHRRIEQVRPDLPVLFLSGYAHDVVASKGVTAMNLLAKPFSLRELTDRVREVLER